MGDWFQHIVVPAARREDAPRLAEAVVNFLVERGIISSERTDCTLGADDGHPPGNCFEQVVLGHATEVRRLRTNGMDVAIGRTVFHGMGADAVRCPNCNANQVESDWIAAIDRWWEGDDNALLACDSCRASSPLTQWIFEPAWGFGHLGFTYWNWPPLKPEFVRQIAEILQHEVLLVSGKL